MCSARALRRRNDVSSFAGFGLNCPRLVFQAHRFPCFSEALPPQKLALPLFPKPGFVTISFRHNSLLCEHITSIIPGPTVSRRSVDHPPTARLRTAARSFYLYLCCDRRVSSLQLTRAVKSAHSSQYRESAQAVDAQLCTPLAIWRR